MCLGYKAPDTIDPKLLDPKYAFEEVEEMVAESNEKHVIRLHQGIKETLDTSSVHLDLVGFLQRIAKLSLNFTQLPDLRGEDR